MKGHCDKGFQEAAEEALAVRKKDVDFLRHQILQSLSLTLHVLDDLSSLDFRSDVRFLSK
jgi:hypothetical protein